MSLWPSDGAVRLTSPAASSTVTAPSPGLSSDDWSRERRLADSELRDLRGGIRVNGLDLSIAARITTIAAGRLELSSELVLGDDGRWRAVLSQSTTLPNLPDPSVSRGSKTITLSAPSSASPTQVNVSLPDTVVADTSATTRAGTGSAAFRATVGNGEGTQIVHQLMNNNIASIISNRVNGAVIDQTTALTINVKNFSSFTTMVGAAAHASTFAADIARYR